MSKSIIWVYVLYIDKIYNISVIVKFKCYCNISVICKERYCIIVIYEYIFIIVIKYIIYE